MSSTLLVVALLVSLVNLFGPGAIAAWGFAGGDGESTDGVTRLLALVVVAGLLVTPAVALRALTGDTPRWWWVTILPALAWLVGAAWVVRPTRRELAVYVVPLAAALAIPAVAMGTA